MRIWKSISLSFLLHIILYGVLAIVIRLHMTQMAYQFHELKAYERSLKEEELRLRAELARELSPNFMKLDEFKAPEPDQVVVIP